MARTATALGATLAVAAVAATTLMAEGASASKKDSARAAAPSVLAIGLSDDGGSIARFETDTPWISSAPLEITGLQDDTEIVGIDYRVQDTRLYGVGDEGGVYRIRAKTGAATLESQLSVPLSGTSFGVDFNPAADRLRVVSDDGQNLRHDLNTDTTVADTTLSYPPAAPPAAGVTSAAYTNNDLAVETATSLFDLDTALDQVALQAPANSGQLSATGKLGVDAAGDSGFDIYSGLGSNGQTQANTGYAVLVVGGIDRLYEIDLLTGRASGLGKFKAGVDVADVTIPLNQH